MSHRGLRLLAVGAVLIAYGGVVIFAGHGAGPVALLMLFGFPSAWLSSQILGWPGALASLAALGARSELSYLRQRFWGALLLVLSVGMFVPRLFFAPRLVETLPRLSVVDAMLIGTLLLLDIVILRLLFTRPASLWLRGRQAHTAHGS